MAKSRNGMHVNNKKRESCLKFVETKMTPFQQIWLENAS